MNLSKVAQAKQYLVEVLKEKRFKYYQKEIHDTFDLFSLYLRLFQGADIDENKLKSFQTYIKDPSGMGISVRVAQLWNAGLKDPQYIADYVASTQKFIQRNLDERHRRSRIMLELILHIPRLMYQKKNFVKITELLYHEMIAIEPYFCPEANEIEIITYEILWHQMLRTIVPLKYESLKSHYSMAYIDRKN